MNDPDDSLEAELTAMRPLAVSTELRRRIAAQLAAPSPMRSTGSWTTPLFAGFAAAGLAAVLVMWMWRNPAVTTRQVAIQPKQQAIIDLNGSQPTVWRYHKAIRHSSADLDAVLGTRRNSSLPPRESTVVAAFTRSPAQLRLLIGEL